MLHGSVSILQSMQKVYVNFRLPWQRRHTSCEKIDREWQHRVPSHARAQCSPLLLQIEILGVDGELKEVAENALRTQPNFAYTLPEVGERNLNLLHP